MASKSAKSKRLLNIMSFLMQIILNIIFYIIVIMIAIELTKTAYDFSYEIFGRVTVDEAPGRDLTVQIENGESAMEIAEVFAANRIIVNKYSFYVRVKITKAKILPGTYTVNSSMGYGELIDIITMAEKDSDTK